MTIRLEVQPDCRIEILRVKDGRTTHLLIDGIARAMRIAEYLLRRDLRQARKDRFVPMLDRECNALLKQELTNHAKS